MIATMNIGRHISIWSTGSVKGGIGGITPEELGLGSGSFWLVMPLQLERGAAASRSITRGLWHKCLNPSLPPDLSCLDAPSA